MPISMAIRQILLVKLETGRPLVVLSCLVDGNLGLVPAVVLIVHTGCVTVCETVVTSVNVGLHAVLFL